MSAYVKSLNRSVAEEHAQIAARKSAEIQTARDRLVTLEDRLARLLANVPEEVQREGLSLPALQAALRGRWRGRCHPGELGTALRKLGFTRVRKWAGNVGFAAVWKKK